MDQPGAPPKVTDESRASFLVTKRGGYPVKLEAGIQLDNSAASLMTETLCGKSN